MVIRGPYLYQAHLHRCAAHAGPGRGVPFRGPYELGDWSEFAAAFQQTDTENKVIIVGGGILLLLGGLALLRGITRGLFRR